MRKTIWLWIVPAGLLVIVALVAVMLRQQLRYSPQPYPQATFRSEDLLHEAEIAKALAAKLERSMTEDHEVNIEDREGAFAVGNFFFGKGYAEGGVSGSFWAVKQGDSWKIAADGNGFPLCSELDPYGFPQRMVDCVDDKTGKLRSEQ